MDTFRRRAALDENNDARRLAFEARVMLLAWDESIVPRKDVIHWADGWIAANVSPDQLAQLADVSVPGRAFYADAREALEKMAEPVTQEAWHALVGLLARYYHRKVLSLDDVARSLFRLVDHHEDVYPHEFFCFWDDLDVAREGYGNIRRVQGQIEAALTEHEGVAVWFEPAPSSE